MPRMSKRDKEEWAFFLNNKGRITYNELCRKCDRDCKQSFRAVIVSCPEYNSKRKKKNSSDAGKGGNNANKTNICRRTILQTI